MSPQPTNAPIGKASKRRPLPFNPGGVTQGAGGVRWEENKAPPIVYVGASVSAYRCNFSVACISDSWDNRGAALLM